MHAVLESAPEENLEIQPSAPIDNRYFLLPLSAKDPATLEALTKRYREFISMSAENQLPNLCYSAGFRRNHYAHRLAFTGMDKKDLIDGMDASLGGEFEISVATGIGALDKSLKMVFVFSGHGSQWRGMGEDLYTNEPVFRGMIDRLDRIFHRYVDWQLRSVLTSDDDISHTQKIDIIQPIVASSVIVPNKKEKAAAHSMIIYGT